MILRRVFSKRKTSPEVVPEVAVNQLHYMALYDYEGQSEKDISFKKGEILEITNESAAGTGWWDARSEATHDVGCIPSNYVTYCESPASLLTTQDWFFGSIGEKEAERTLLQQGETGSFLISGGAGHQRNDFCLSLRDGDAVKHYAIQYTDTEGYYITPWAKFATLSNLVHHYQQNSDGVVTKLKKPCAPLDVVPVSKEQGINRKKKRNTRSGSVSGKFNGKEIEPATPSRGESESSALTEEESVASSLEEELRKGHPQESGKGRHHGTIPKDVKTKGFTSWRGVEIIKTLPLFPLIGAVVLFAHVTSLWTE